MATAPSSVTLTIPSQFRDTPIAKFLKIHQGKATEFFIENVLKNVTPNQFNKVLKWGKWDDSDFKCWEKFAYPHQIHSIDCNLYAMACLVLLKKEMKARYPEHKVKYNKDCTYLHSSIPTRNWLTIDGIAGTKFDTEHGGLPIHLPSPE